MIFFWKKRHDRNFRTGLFTDTLILKILQQRLVRLYSWHEKSIHWM